MGVETAASLYHKYETFQRSKKWFIPWTPIFAMYFLVAYLPAVLDLAYYFLLKRSRIVCNSFWLTAVHVINCVISYACGIFVLFYFVLECDSRDKFWLVVGGVVSTILAYCSLGYSLMRRYRCLYLWPKPNGLTQYGNY